MSGASTSLRDPGPNFLRYHADCDCFVSNGMLLTPDGLISCQMPFAGSSDSLTPAASALFLSHIVFLQNLWLSEHGT